MELASIISLEGRDSDSDQRRQRADAWNRIDYVFVEY